MAAGSNAMKSTTASKCSRASLLASAGSLMSEMSCRAPGMLSRLERLRSVTSCPREIASLVQAVEMMPVPPRKRIFMGWKEWGAGERGVRGLGWREAAQAAPLFVRRGIRYVRSDERSLSFWGGGETLAGRIRAGGVPLRHALVFGMGKVRGSVRVMTDKLTIEAKVTYADVDRDEAMLLPRIFKLLQEAAILHANQFDTGTRALTERGETWVLNRMAVAVRRYPRFEDTLRVETWSSGIRGCKGFREFRVLDATGGEMIAGSSLWIYVSVRTNGIVRVPREVAGGFPTREGDVFCGDLEKWEAVPPKDARAMSVTLRYSDFDVNQHVNNAAYLDLVQTALVEAGGSARPAEVRVKFAKAIAAGCRSVDVRVGQRAEGTMGRAFSVEAGGRLFAVGEVKE